MNEDCLKLTAYFAERDRSRGGEFLGDALLGICERHGLATSILLRGAEGFGRHQVLQTDRLLSLSSLLAPDCFVWMIVFRMCWWRCHMSSSPGR